jgi:hypothetical protein
MNRKLALGFCALALSFVGCTGMRSEPSGMYTVHAESFRIFGFAIPGDDQEAAAKMVPAGSTVFSSHSTAADWTSWWGFWGNILGFHRTVISGKK